MNRKTRAGLLGWAFRLPGLCPLLAFLTARRVLVRGWSMYPALRPGERVLFDRMAYALSPPRPGDIVLASHPARPGVRLLKRVTAGPGDSFSPDGVLGEDEYALLGDAPDFSTDSRQLGPVRRDDIHARAWIVSWPPERFRRL
jgi:nickel-type superoxide dismutase maturation protease